MGVQFFTRFNRPLVSGLSCLKPSMTSQEFKDETNINNILKRYAVQARVMGVPLHELLPKLGSAPYGDFTNLDDFQENMNKIARQKELFESLPSDIRAKYGNTVEGFLRALNNPDEYKFLADRGVLNKGEVNEFFQLRDEMAQAKSKEVPSGGKNESSKSESSASE